MNKLWTKLSPRGRQPWHCERYWALDLETSGLDPQSCEILSVGMVPISEGNILWHQRSYQQVRPSRDRVGSARVVAIHQLLASELRDSPTLSEFLPDILRRLEHDVLLVHHRSIDWSFLCAAARDHALQPPSCPVVDTVDLIGRYNQKGQWLGRGHEPLPLNLSGVRTRLALPEHQAHDALHDALATAELMLCLRARLGIERFGQLL